VSQQANVIVIPVILASGIRSQAFVADLRLRSAIVDNTRVANLTFMRATGVQVFPGNDHGAQAALFETKEKLMRPLADLVQENSIQFEVDHIMARSMFYELMGRDYCAEVGVVNMYVLATGHGVHSMLNLQLLCKKCHDFKNMMWSVYIIIT
jgi:hypothetical protein